MAKYIKTQGVADFEEIISYINENRGKNYYITSSLMLSLMYSDYNCVAGIIPFDITNRGKIGIDIVVFPEYNKVFQERVFRVDGVKDFMGVRELPNEISQDYILFTEEDDSITFDSYIEQETL